MSDNNSVAKVQLPTAPVLSDELLDAVKDIARYADTSTPPMTVFAQAQSYCEYVRRLVQELDQKSRVVVQKVDDIELLSRLANELQAQEARRSEGLQPCIGNTNLPAKIPKGGWAGMLAKLHNHMAAELEALRDTRLRIEVRRAELVNQQAAPKLRVVLQGGHQLRLHFQLRQRGNASQKN
jgi:hypothetical protein